MNGIALVIVILWLAFGITSAAPVSIAMVARRQVAESPGHQANREAFVEIEDFDRIVIDIGDLKLAGIGIESTED